MIRADESFYVEDVNGPCPKYLRIKILYPVELAREEIQRKSIDNVNEAIGEYITNLELSHRCKDEYSKLFFDSQKDKKKSELEKYYDEMYKLKTIMDKGISPYEWKVRKPPIGNRFRADYVVCLEKRENNDE